VGWEGVDEGWGHRAVDFAYLFESQMWPEYVALQDACGVADGVDVLDVACGSGLAVRLASERGARVAGIDASARLVQVARLRSPHADVRVGDMFALPWPDATFDVVTSHRGIWGGCEAALAEAVRVCRPGGRVGLTFWGNAKKMAAYPLLKLFGRVSEHDSAHAKEMANIAWAGVAEQMMVDAGLAPGERWTKAVPMEYPDPDLAARALSSSGPAYLVIQTMGQEAFLEAAREAAKELQADGGGVRFAFDVQLLVGTKPEAAQ
jgi:SAM-dependent methyltransferase